MGAGFPTLLDYLQSASSESSPTLDRTIIAVPGSVGFDIQPGPAPGNSEAWLARYAAQGKTAKFRIEMGPSKALDDKVLDMIHVR